MLTGSVGVPGRRGCGPAHLVADRRAPPPRPFPVSLSSSHTLPRGFAAGAAVGSVTVSLRPRDVEARAPGRPVLQAQLTPPARAFPQAPRSRLGFRLAASVGTVEPSGLLSISSERKTRLEPERGVRALDGVDWLSASCGFPG